MMRGMAKTTLKSFYKGSLKDSPLAQQIFELILKLTSVKQSKMP